MFISGKEKDPYLLTVARNFWLHSGQHNIYLHTVHILHKGNTVAVL